MDRPNVLWIMSDQHNAACMGCAGHRTVQTPNLDRIAGRGIRFSSAYCNNPICSPSRICFMSGQYAHNHGMYGNHHNEYRGPSPDLLSSRFWRSGYQTALIGKSHMVPSWDREGFEFIRYTDLCDAPYQDPQGTHYFQYLVANGLADRYEEGSPLPERRCVLDGSKPANLPYEHSIERFTGNSALEFLGRRDKQRPFFMHLSFQRPHAPIAPSREHFDLYDPDAIDLPENADDYFSRRFEGKPEFMRDALRDGCEYPLADPDKGRLRRCLASYYALITAIDGEIGRVLDDLERTGELANTVIVYTADHGDFAGEHGLFHKNFGIYDSIQKIPFLLSFPGSPCGTACDALIESVDLFPTLCELCGVETPSDIDGSSLVPVLNGNAPEKDAVYCEWDSFYHRRKIAAIRTRQHRLVFYGGVDGGELYDHDQDPGEAINLWDHHGLQPLRRSLTDRLFSFCMNYRVKTDYTLDMILDNQYANTPTLLLHRHGKKWSDLNTIFKI